MKALSFVLSLALLAAPLNAKPRSDATDAAFQAAVARYEVALEKEGVVGGGVALVTPKGLIAERDYGFADKAAGRKAGPDTIYHWASVTKVFTSIAAMQLVERGKLSLDDPVTKYIPELRKAHNPYGSMDDITIRNLLTHSSGLRGPTWPWNGDGAADATDWQPHEPTDWSQIEAMFPYTGIGFKPGSKADYSNLGLSLLGRVVEVVSGDDIEIYITKNILMPLGMTRSYFDATPWYLAGDRTHGYLNSKGVVEDRGAEVLTGATHANGGLNGPISDMAKFTAWLMGGPPDYPVIKRETLERMLEPQLVFEKDARRTLWIGLGFFIIDERDASGEVHRYFGHSGFQLAHRSTIYMSKDNCCAFIFAANTVTRGSGNPSAPALRADIVDTVFSGMRRAMGGKGR